MPDTPPRDAEVHVFASRFETLTRWGALKIFARTRAVRRQVSKAPGTYGATRKAAPLRQTVWTLSVWESPAALKAFALSGTHAPTARNLRPQSL